MKKTTYQPYAIATVFCWAMAFVLTRKTAEYFSAASLGFWRYLIASAALVIIAVIMKIKPPKLSDWPLFLLSGFVGFFLYMLVFNMGISLVPAATGSVVNATVPAVTAVIASFVYREKIKRAQWIAITIEFVGVVILAVMSGGLSESRGLLWLFLAALALSSYNLIQRKLTQKYTAMQSSTYSIFAGAVMLSVFSPAAIAELSAAPPTQYLYITLLGIFPSAIAYISWSVAFSKAERTSQVSNYTVLTLFFTALLGIVILREIPNPATLCGGIITLIGVLIFNYGDRSFLCE